MAISDYPGDIPQLKRRQDLTGQGSIPPGIALSPDQQEAQRRQANRKRMAENIQQSKASIGSAVDTASGSIASIPKAIGSALANANVYDRPFDYSTPAKEAAKPGPTPQQQAGAIMAFDMAKRATDAGIAYDRQMRAMPRPPADIPNTLKAPQADGTKTSSGGTSSSSAPGGQQARDGSVQPGGPGQWSKTGIGVGRDGGEIVGRMGVNGVPEFSNDTTAQQGAGPQRAIGSVGNGIGGGISVGVAGDSQLAMDRFDRANAERGRMVDVQRDIDAMRGLTGVRGITEGLSSDPIKARRQIREAEIRQGDEGLAAERAEVRQRGIDAGLDRSLRERELTAAEQRNQLEGQRTQQEIEAGDMTLVQQRRADELFARIADPATDPTEREALLRTYSQLTGKKLDNGTIKLKRKYVDQNGNVEEEYLADARTGQPVAQGGSTPGKVPLDNHVAALKKSPAMAAQFDEIYGQGAAARIIGGGND